MNEWGGSEVLVSTHSLGFAVEGATILRSVSLSVRRGEFVGVIGPNGAGKTTLLRALVGMVKPTAGQISLGGKPLGSLGPRERARLVSFLPQESFAAFPFPVLDVVLMGRYPFLGRLRAESEADLEKARRALEYVGLSGFEERYFTELSGGERQLVLFARVLTQETELLLLDEPTANLDIRHQDQLFSMAWELAREGKGLIASVHNLNTAAQYCSRLVLLDRGQVARDGKPHEVLRSDLLDRVYGARTSVAHNPTTGSLTVTVSPQRVPDRSGPRVHLVGGAGSAVNLTRELSRLGYRLSAGIAHEYDADEELWRALGVPHHTVGAFDRIRAQDAEAAAAMVTEADALIVCSFPIGPGNLENLRLAARAKRVYMVQPGREDVPRTFFAEQARELFDTLATRAVTLGYGELVELAASGGLAEDR